MMGLPLARHEIIRYWGAAILVAGLVAAALIYAFASEDRDLEAAAEIARRARMIAPLRFSGSELGRDRETARR